MYNGILRNRSDSWGRGLGCLLKNTEYPLVWKRRTCEGTARRRTTIWARRPRWWTRAEDNIHSDFLRKMRIRLREPGYLRLAGAWTRGTTTRVTRTGLRCPAAR